MPRAKITDAMRRAKAVKEFNRDFKIVRQAECQHMIGTVGAAVALTAGKVAVAKSYNLVDKSTGKAVLLRVTKDVVTRYAQTYVRSSMDSQKKDE